MAYNYAHDVELPGSTGRRVAFLMYPQAETGAGASTAWTRTSSATRSSRARSRSSRARCGTDASGGTSRGVFLS